MVHSRLMRVESTLFFEPVEEIFARVYRELKPRTEVPGISVEFCKFANANNFIRLEGQSIHVRVADVLRAAPASIIEALALILVSKLYRKPIPKSCTQRYRLYLNRRDVRQELQRLRQERGHKLVRHPSGEAYDLVQIFEELNLKFFGGLMSRPELGWSLRASRSALGHYDPSHHAIVLSRALDRPTVPRVAVDYVMFHEMLHLRHPVEHRGIRRCVHTPEFKRAEKEFPQLEEARLALKLI